jgi:putative flippase GtrA
MPHHLPRPTPRARPARYLAVAALGAVVQGLVLAAAVRARCPPVAATVLGIEMAILHNFAWHDRWTWGDRAHRDSYVRRLARYNVAVGSSSLGVGAAVTWLVVDGLGWSVFVANVLAVGAAALANYVASDRFVFTGRPPRVLETPHSRHLARTLDNVLGDGTGASEQGRSS